MKLERAELEKKFGTGWQDDEYDLMETHYFSLTHDEPVPKDEEDAIRWICIHEALLLKFVQEDCKSEHRGCVRRREILDGIFKKIEGRVAVLVRLRDKKNKGAE